MYLSVNVSNRQLGYKENTAINQLQFTRWWWWWVARTTEARHSANWLALLHGALTVYRTKWVASLAYAISTPYRILSFFVEMVVAPLVNELYSFKEIFKYKEHNSNKSCHLTFWETHLNIPDENHSPTSLYFIYN